MLFKKQFSILVASALLVSSLTTGSTLVLAASSTRVTRVRINTTDIARVTVSRKINKKTSKYNISCYKQTPGFTSTINKTKYFTALNSLISALRASKNKSDRSKIALYRYLIKKAAPLCVAAQPKNDNNKSCTLADKEISSGATVTAYEQSSVGFGESCKSEVRTCTNGTLSGSFQSLACTVAAAKDCQFDGKNVANAASVDAYQSASVPFGSTCVKQTRVCNNGTLSGDYTAASCSIAPASSCFLFGQEIPSSQSITAYQTNSVAFGSSCKSESRTCTNAHLSGSYAFQSCSVEAAKSCTFNGQTVAHAASVPAYLTSSVAFGQVCTQQSRTCNNGVLSGSYSYSSCAPEAPKSCTLDGRTVASGQSITAYPTKTVAFGNTCTAETRTCTNGVLSGSNAYSSCTVVAASDCVFSNSNIIVPHGTSVQAFQTSRVPYSETCAQETRSCQNGKLTGSYQYSQCQTGFSFNQIDAGTTEDLSAVSYGDSTFVVAANGSTKLLRGTIEPGAKSFSWQSVGFPTGLKLGTEAFRYAGYFYTSQNAITYGDGIFITRLKKLDGSAASSFLYCSLDAGVTWTGCGPAAPTYLQLITAGVFQNGVFQFAGVGPMLAGIESNLKSWIPPVIGADPAELYAAIVPLSSGGFAAAGGFAIVRITSDGVNWKLVARRPDSPAYTLINGIASGRSIFAATSTLSDGGHGIFTSSEATTPKLNSWNLSEFYSDKDGKLHTFSLANAGAIHNNGKPLVGICLQKGDPTPCNAWDYFPNQHTGLVHTPQLRAITYIGDQFLAVGEKGFMIASTDGINWVQVPAVTDQNLNGVGYASDGPYQGQIVLVGDHGTLIAGR